MAGKYSEFGVGGLTGDGVNTRTRKVGGPTGGGADGTATSTVTGTGRVINNVDRFIDRVMGREGAPGKNENEETRTATERENMSSGRNRR